jgi:hypothetical protein
VTLSLSSGARTVAVFFGCHHTLLHQSLEKGTFPFLPFPKATLSNVNFSKLEINTAYRENQANYR